jgi:hypothetical protein
MEAVRSSETFGNRHRYQQLIGIYECEARSESCTDRLRNLYSHVTSQHAQVCRQTHARGSHPAQQGSLIRVEPISSGHRNRFHRAWFFFRRSTSSQRFMEHARFIIAFTWGRNWPLSSPSSRQSYFFVIHFNIILPYTHTVFLVVFFGNS